MFGPNTSYLDKNKHQKNLLNASHLDRWNAKTKKFNWEVQTLQKMQKKKNYIMREIGGRQSLLFLFFFFFENKK